MLNSEVNLDLFKRHYRKMLILLILYLVGYAAFSIRKNVYELWMRYDIRNEYVVLSLTTTPHRINAIAPVINFILNEKIPLQTIYLNIPYVFKRDNLEYHIPNWLENNKHITILRTKDYGPGTKLLGTLEQAQLPTNAIIITVDDDITYPQNMLLYLIYKAKHNPNYAVGYSGMNPHYNKKGVIIVDSRKSIGLKSDKRSNAFVAVLEGFGGVAYRPHFFDQTIFDLENAPRVCFNSDDLYLSFHLAKRGIPRQVLRSKFMNLDNINWNIEVGFNQDALHQLTPKPAVRHRDCMVFMKEQYPDVKF